MKVWIDGRVCDEADARVSPFDHGLLTGDGVFETLKTYGGKPFGITRHLERLAASAAGLGLVTLPENDLIDAVHAVIRANHLGDARIRITVTGGLAPLGSDRGDAGPMTVIAGGALPDWPATADVVVVPWTRNEHGALVGLKTTSYGENVVAVSYAHERDAAEGIFANTAGNLCEGSGTNVFLVVGGRLLTPPLSSGCLAGVTRALVIEQTGAAEEDVPVATLAEADEAFLTSSTREVQPIRAVDGIALRSAPGPFTAGAAEAFKALVTVDLDP